MLETLRKHHYILMLFIAVIVCVAFVFFGDVTHSRRGGTEGIPIFKVDGQDYFQEDARRIATQENLVGILLDPTNPMARYTDPLAQYVNRLSSVAARFGRRSREEPNLDFVTNVAVLRSEAKKLGVEADRDDLLKFVQTIPGLQTNGQFDSQKYEAVLNSKVVGDRTNTERELYVMLRDVITFQKIQNLIGGSFTPSKAEVDFEYASQHEITTAASTLVEKSKQTAEAPTDEAIQKFYDGEKAKFEKQSGAINSRGELPPPADPLVLSEEKRSVKYLLINLPKLPPVVPTPKPEDTSGLSEDQKKTKEEEFKKKMEEHTAAMAKRADEVKAYEAGQKDLQTKAAMISDQLVSEDRGAKTFEEIVKAAGLEPKTSELFTRAAPPAELQAQPKTVAEIFAETDAKVSRTVTLPENAGYALFELAKVEAPAMLPLDQVKAKITEKLKADALTAALKAAAITARTKIQDALKAGKSFPDAATEAGLTAVDFPAFSSRKKPAADAKNGAIITTQSASLNPGEVSEPQPVDEGLLLVAVIKKELPKDPKMDEDKKSLMESGTLSSDSPFSVSPVFEAWLSSRRAAAAEVKVGS